MPGLHRSCVVSCACGVLLAAGSASIARAQSTFTVLPSSVTAGEGLIGGYAFARGVSGDERVVIGSTANGAGTSGEAPWIWKKNDAGEWTRTLLPCQRAGSTFRGGRAVALSRDGSTVVGMLSVAGQGSVAPGTMAVWRNATSATPLLSEPLPLTSGEQGQFFRGQLSGVSADGSRMSGFAAPRHLNSEIPKVYVGTSASMTTPAGQVAAQDYFSGVIPTGGAMTADGSKVVGWRRDTVRTTAFQWTADTGFRDLSSDGAGADFSNLRAEVVSANGAVIGGYKLGERGPINTGGRPVIWRDNGTRLINLALPAGILQGRVLALSGNGSIVGGVTGNTLDLINDLDDRFSGLTAMLWVNDAQITLRQYLLNNGLNVGETNLSYVTGISEDGRTFVGAGNRTVAGQRQFFSFIATVPSPGTGVLLGLAGLAAARRRR
ncbi:MAG: hypothetical protein JSR77_10795 [Planctomycetes bacterium]|nr:hypothetical protein [Planctomycetota bacterium]